MIELKSNIKTYFKKKRLNVFTTFLGLALLFSLLTKLSSDYTKTITFNVNPINVPEDRIILNDSNQHIKVTLTTYGFRLFKYYFNNPTIDIDFANLESNNNHYIWTERKERSNIISQFTANEDIEGINPDTVMFSYSKNAVRLIPVQLKKDISFSIGYNLYEDLEVTPDSIKIIGPERLIDTIKVVETEHITFKNVDKNILTDVNLKLPNLTSGITFSNQKVKVSGTVEKFTEGAIDVPVNVVNIPDSITINYYPKTIPVVFSTSLNNYKLISSNSFIIECDYNQLNTKGAYLNPKLVRIPKEVKDAKLDVKRVEFILIE